jgi:hypothetical protein
MAPQRSPRGGETGDAPGVEAIQSAARPGQPASIVRDGVAGVQVDPRIQVLSGRG